MGELEEVFPIDLSFGMGHQEGGVFCNGTWRSDLGPSRASMLVGLHVLGHYLQLGHPEALKLRKLAIHWTSTDVEYAPFFAIPDSLRRLQSVDELFIYSAASDILPDWLGELSALERVTLKIKRLSEFPAFLFCLPRLKTLDLSGAYGLESDKAFDSLPKRVSELQQLEVLKLDSMNLKRLPESFPELRALESLALDCDVIFPQGMERLQALRRLKFYTDPRRPGRLEEVPNWVWRLANLEELDLSEVRGFKSLDGIENLKKLRILWLQGTDFDTYEELLSRVPWVSEIRTARARCFEDGRRGSSVGPPWRQPLDPRIVYERDFADEMDRHF
ncbi:MAG: hypothetical protein QF464_07690 [Myxococcota bacterium]|nr:hypothetical protein [Myxococcota bacterium]